MFKLTLDPHAAYVGVTVESKDDAAHFCKAAAEVVCGVESYDQVGPDIRKIYEQYATRMSEDLTALWDRTLWDYVFEIPVGPHIKVSTTFGVLVLSKLGII